MLNMKKILKPIFLSGLLSMTIGCSRVIGNNPTVSSTPEGARQFEKLGTAAGKACVAHITKSGNAASILKKAGYSKARTSRTHEHYVIRLDGGKKSIDGKNIGGSSVALPNVAQLSGVMRCSASVGGFSRTDGDVFYRAFQDAGKTSSIGAQVRFSGRYENGRSNMGMKY